MGGSAKPEPTLLKFGGPEPLGPIEVYAYDRNAELSDSVSTLNIRYRRYNIKPSHAVAATFCSNTSVELTQLYEASNKISNYIRIASSTPIKKCL